MKRSEFKRKPPEPYVKPERIPQVYARLTVPVNQARISVLPMAIPKEAPVRSEAYRRLVAAMPCMHCGIQGHSQAAHADMGKGAHIKSDDRTCFPACAARPDGSIGCHALIGATGTYSRETRRHLEEKYAALTRKHIRLSGQWPKDLPKFEDQPELEHVP